MNTQAFRNFYAATLENMSVTAKSCPIILWHDLITKLIFELFSKNCSYINPKKTSEMLKKLIKDYRIKNNLFNYLKNYNTSMICLYG